MLTLPLTQRVAQKSEFVVFVNKIQVQSNKGCYKVSVCKNKVVVEPFPYLTVYMLAVYITPKSNFSPKMSLTHPLQHKPIDVLVPQP